MTQENKDLLLKDLCARLPYGVKVKLGDNPNIFDLEYVIKFNAIYGDSNKLEDILNIINIRPYLFPLSSMTEEQKKYIADRWGVNEDFDFEIDPNGGEYFVDLGDVVNYVNWLIENHFDIYGLIPKGLAIDATGLTFINWRNREYDGN